MIFPDERIKRTVNKGPYGRTGGGSGFWNTYYSQASNSPTGAWNKYRNKIYK